MKDVIFQGSKNRKPSGMAEVVLHWVRDDDFFDAGDEELTNIDEALNAFDDKAVDMGLIEARSPRMATIFDSIESNGFAEQEFEVEQLHAAQSDRSKPSKGR